MKKKLAQFISLELQNEGYRVDLLETGKDVASARIINIPVEFYA